MKRDEFAKFVETLLQDATKLLDQKGFDYAGDEDVLKNFKQNAERLGMVPDQIWAIYFMKHIDAILTYTRNGEVKSEAIEGRVIDAINYLILFAALLEEKRNNAG